MRLFEILLTAEEKTMGLQCARECIFISLGKVRGFEIVAMVMLTKPVEGFVRFMHCEVFLCPVEFLHLHRKLNCEFGEF